MNYAYDYEELIEEIKEALKDEMITMDSDIQILRGDTATTPNYKPIADWYYSKEDMEEILLPDSEGTEEEIQELEELKQQYRQDESELKTMKVSDCLNEMENAS